MSIFAVDKGGNRRKIAGVGRLFTSMKISGLVQNCKGEYDGAEI